MVALLGCKHTVWPHTNSTHSKHTHEVSTTGVVVHYLEMEE